VNDFLSFAVSAGIVISFKRGSSGIVINLTNGKASADLDYDPSLGDIWNGRNLSRQWDAVKSQFLS
jgi:hypothetical protein